MQANDACSTNVPFFAVRKQQKIRHEVAGGAHATLAACFVDFSNFFPTMTFLLADDKVTVLRIEFVHGFAVVQIDIVPMAQLNVMKRIPEFVTMVLHGYASLSFRFWRRRLPESNVPGTKCRRGHWLRTMPQFPRVS